jgi:type II secretion system protein N
VDFAKNLRLRAGNLAARLPKFPKLPSIIPRGNPLRKAAYLLYALILGVILLVWKFPYGSLQQRLEGAAGRALGGARVEMREVSPAFPFGLKVSRVVVRTWEAGREPVFDMTQGYLRFRILPLLRGAVGVVVEGRAYGGTVSGGGSWSLGQDRAYQLQAVLQSLRLGEHPGIAQLFGRHVSGTVSGEVQMSGPTGDKMKSGGGGKIQLRQGSWPVESPYLKIKSLDEMELNATVKLGEGTLTVEGCDLKATGIQGTLKGSVSLATTWSESILELAGEGQVDGAILNLEPAVAARIQPLLQQGKPIPFHIRGTLGAPQLSIF